MHRIDSLTSGRANAVTGNDAAHAAPDECSMAKTSEIDGDNVPCRHFGVVLTMKQWHELADRLQAARTDIFEPHIRFVSVRSAPYGLSGANAAMPRARSAR